jgi:hypothetical protein
VYHFLLGLISVLQWVEDSSLAIAIRRSAWLYPALEIVHISGIVLLVGPAFMFDLRLLGFAQKISVDVLGRFLLSWSRRALLLIIPSGILLFSTNATTLGYDPVFWIKMGLLVIAGLNALAFHRYTLRIVSSLDTTASLGVKAKLHAMISIIAWLATIACGRLLAY